MYDNLTMSDLLGEDSRGFNDPTLLGASVPQALATPAHRQAALSILRQKNVSSSNLGFSGNSTANVAIAAAGVQITATTIPQKNFKCAKLMVAVTGSVTDSGTVARTAYFGSNIANGVYLMGATASGDNLFPVAQSTTSGNGTGAMNCAFYPSNGLGNGVSWKMIKAGLQASLTFLVGQNGIYALATAAFFNQFGVVPFGALTFNVTVDGGMFGPQWD